MRLARKRKFLRARLGRTGTTHHHADRLGAGRQARTRGARALRAARCRKVHEIGKQAPFEVWLAIPNRVAAPRIEQPAIRVVRMSDDALTEGLQRKRIDGVEVPIFKSARTVVDCFRFRNKMGLDVALEALREGWRERRFTLDELWHHATRRRVANVMRPCIEAITA